MLIFNLVPGAAVGFVRAGWTIGVEVVFYALFPFIYRRIGSIEHGIALLFACLLVWQGLSAVLIYSSIPEAWKQTYLAWSAFRHFPIFAAGIVLYQLFARWPAMDEAHRRQIGDMLVWAGMFGFWALVTIGYGCTTGRAWYSARCTSAPSLSPWPILANRLTAYLGKRSAT